MKLRLVSLMFAVAVATPALSQNVASFVVNNDDGYGVDSCLESGTACAMPIATEWCQANGYKKATAIRKQSEADITGAIKTPTQIASASPHAVVITCER